MYFCYYCDFYIQIVVTVITNPFMFKETNIFLVLVTAMS